jgi:hypothetical protein
MQHRSPVLPVSVSAAFAAPRRAAFAAPAAVVFLFAFFALTMRVAPDARAAPYIDYLYPAGAAVGETLEITLGGKSLEGAREVWVSGEGVTGEVLGVREPTAQQIAASKQRDEVASQNARLRIRVAPGAAAGVRDLRIMGNAGLSNRFRFEIGQHREVSESEPNDTLALAHALPLPVTVNGQITNADRDWFRFRAKAGQKLLLQVRARAIKPFLADAVPGWFQARLALHDAVSGKKLAEVDDFRFDPDPVMLWQAPADGEYAVCVWDALSRGRDDFVYRLTLGELPFVTDVFPLGARSGRTELTVRGINLAPKPPAPATVSAARAARTRAAASSSAASSAASSVAVHILPAEPEAPATPLETFVLKKDFTGRPFGITEVGFETPQGATNILPFELSLLPEVFERNARNDKADTAQRVSVPVVVNGRIETSGDVDCYAFEAKRGESFVIDVMARRLGSPLDAKVRVGPAQIFQKADSEVTRQNKAAPPAPRPAANARRANAARTGGPQRFPTPVNDDTKDERHGLVTHHADSRVQFTAPETALYHVFVADAQGQGGAEYAYRLRIAPPQPDYELRVSPDNMTAPAAGNAILRLNAFRQDGFDGPISLFLEGLPAGFKLGSALIPEGKNNAVFSLAVPPNAKPGVYKPLFYAEAELPVPGSSQKRRVRRNVNAAESLMQAFFLTHTVPVAQSYLIVRPVAPFGVEIVRSKFAKSKTSSGKKAAGDAPLEIPVGVEVEIPVRIIYSTPQEKPATKPATKTAAATATGRSAQSAEAAEAAAEKPTKAEKSASAKAAKPAATSATAKKPSSFAAAAAAKAAQSAAQAETSADAATAKSDVGKTGKTAKVAGKADAGGKGGAGKRRDAARVPEPPGKIRVTVQNGARGMEVWPAEIEPGATEGVIKVLCEGGGRVGEEAVFVIEASQRTGGRRSAVFAPVLPYKIVAAPKTKTQQQQ